MRVSAWTVACCMAILIAGCASSPPVHYYTLSGTGAGSRLNAAGPVAVRLDKVAVPAELDRPQLVRRVSATQLQVLDSERWAAPLEDMIRRVLSDNLAARLPANLVADPNEPASSVPRQLLSLDVRDFYADSTCAVTLRAAWTVKRTDGQFVQGTEEIQVAGSGCAGAGTMPAAMSQALGELSDRLAARLAQLTDDSHQQAPGDR